MQLGSGNLDQFVAGMYACILYCIFHKFQSSQSKKYEDKKTDKTMKNEVHNARKMLNLMQEMPASYVHCVQQKACIHVAIK